MTARGCNIVIEHVIRIISAILVLRRREKKSIKCFELCNLKESDLLEYLNVDDRTILKFILNK